MSDIVSKIELARGGDVNAFGDIVEEYQSAVRGFIAMLGVRPGAVEDVAQQTFISAYKALKGYDSTMAFLPWVRGIARNHVRRHFRDEATDQSRVARLMDSMDEQELEAAAARRDNFRVELLQECVQKLSGKSADMVRQRYYEEKDMLSIGRVLNLSPAAVRVAMGRVREKLRECVERKMAGERI